MSLLTVNIMPAVEDRGPRTFSTHNKHDAETVISLLKYLHGEGYLTYSNGVIIPSDPENQLEAGEYFFTLLSAPQGQGLPVDTSAADCARMLDGVPQVPQSREEFQSFLRTGTLPLTPSLHIHFVANHPELTHSLFAAGSDYSGLAAHVSVLVRSYKSSAGQNEERVGQIMTAFTAALWAEVESVAPNSYDLIFDRNRMPDRTTTDSKPTEGRTRPDLTVVVERLLLFIGEEKKAGVGRDLAQRDIMMKLQGGLPPLFYRDIPYMPVYAAAGDQIQFGFVLANGKVDWADQVLDLNRPQDRVKCLLASIAIYRLFAALLCLAPAQSQRAAFYFPLSRPNSTYITYFPDRMRDARTVVTKEIFQPATYFADYRLNFEDLEEAYRWANTSDHMVHANRGPMLVDRRHPETDVRQGAYFVQLTTVGSLRDLRTWTLHDLRAAISATLQAARLLHSKGLVHTDLRSENILWRQGTPFVTDLEQVHKAGFEAKDLNFVSWTRSTLDENGCYTDRSDMEQIGVLMQSWDTASGQQLEAQACTLMEALITKSLSADEALQHEWFM